MAQAAADAAAGLERANCALYRAALERALAMLRSRRMPPAKLLDQIATLEARVGALVTLQMHLEAEARE